MLSRRERLTRRSKLVPLELSVLLEKPPEVKEMHLLVRRPGPRNELRRKQQLRAPGVKETKAKAAKEKEKEKRTMACAMKNETKACAARLNANSSTTILNPNATRVLQLLAHGADDPGAEEVDLEAAKETEGLRIS